MAINWTNKNKNKKKLTVEGCITFEVFWLEVSSTDSCMFSYDKVLASNCRYPLCSNHLVRWELVATSSAASGHAAVSHVRANIRVRNNYQKNTFATDTKTKLLQQRVDYYSKSLMYVRVPRPLIHFRLKHVSPPSEWILKVVLNRMAHSRRVLAHDK